MSQNFTRCRHNCVWKLRSHVRHVNKVKIIRVIQYMNSFWTLTLSMYPSDETRHFIQMKLVRLPRAWQCCHLLWLESWHNVLTMCSCPGPGGISITALTYSRSNTNGLFSTTVWNFCTKAQVIKQKVAFEPYMWLGNILITMSDLQCCLIAIQLSGNNHEHVVCKRDCHNA